jgi:hypothetical protein
MELILYSNNNVLIVGVWLDLAIKNLSGSSIPTIQPIFFPFCPLVSIDYTKTSRTLIELSLVCLMIATCCPRNRHLSIGSDKCSVLIEPQSRTSPSRIRCVHAM